MMTPRLEVMKRTSWDAFMEAAGTPGIIDLVFEALTAAGYAVVPLEPTDEQMSGLVSPAGYCSIPLRDAIKQWIAAAKDQQ